MFIDIKKQAPSEGESYFVDTNVWYWITYASSKTFTGNGPKGYQTEFYPNFIEQALDNKGTLYYSPLTLVELTRLIERSEFEIFKAYKKTPDATLKSFRRIGSERKAVIQELKSAWEQVQSLAKELPAHLELGVADSIMKTVETNLVDGYDALYCHFMSENKVPNIITDDKDFKGIAGINLYSCYE
ncbi:type II toxin-antitoxin system VapC family toxin [Pseudomonas sp. CFBP 13727]|uniref:type II toxin-antitoxin system VapC family toxin n=1 Tax=Pseudomonas sp. CFBP 13727 TaxID=2775295 RepID=UPI001786889A|nr:PIN domain-containing protein [Pseudomonas sp. CFBP 13727]MBD8625256.1 PIN domain-containing protein [Pseudomonas sp. CFBP 13727]